MWRPADIASARRQARTLREREHRPWPMPKRPSVMGQTWEGLLFAHWRVDEKALRAVVPPQIPIDTFDGSAWIGVTPFLVTGMRARLIPPLSGLARFPEINVRTYATVDNRPGVHFFSLDTPHPLAVAAARRPDRLRRRARRRRWPASGDPAVLPADGAACTAPPGSFEQWATERYCLYTLDESERVLRVDIHHSPWPLQPAEAVIAHNSMGDQVGIALDGPPVLHFAARQDVVFWPNEAA